METWSAAAAYDAIADWYAGVRSNQGLTQIEAALALGIGRGAALDLGCGSGRPLLARLAAAGFAQLIGVDCSAAMLRHAAHAVPTATLIRADLSDWQAGAPVDLILAWDSLFHIPSDHHVALLARWAGWLAPGGVLLVSVGDMAVAGQCTGTMQGREFIHWALASDDYVAALRGAGLQDITLLHDQPGEPHLVLRARRGRMA